ncbi:hypothetical protein A2U01_0085079 [Trifolium medium]|uniref:Uncharacterized protein n=1 Tax=Trifolium medium TaxID=97028 RepID=A0A392TS07_9FABA|nr:hypothetical protein [Trifolium medium]
MEISKNRRQKTGGRPSSQVADL